MRVADIMTRDLVTLSQDESVAAGLSRAQERDLHHVLIMADDRLAGIVCVCDLRERPRTEALGGCIARAPEVIEPGATLDEAAEAFVARSVSCFPVCDGGKLVGVVTRGDLRGVVDSNAKLPEHFECSYCGSTRHVRLIPGNKTLAACLECTDRSAPAGANLYEEGTKD